jgi:hypothetical protein
MPNVSKSLAVGGIAAAASSFLLPLGALGEKAGTTGKIVVAGYNAAVAGVGDVGATGVTNSGSPDLSASVGMSSSARGAVMTGMMPGSMGNFVSQINRIQARPAQNAISNASKQKERK